MHNAKKKAVVSLEEMPVFLNRDERFECERERLEYHSFLCRDKLSFLTFLTQGSEPETVEGNTA